MTLLVDVVPMGDVGVRGHQREPPRRAGLLSADADEVGGAGDLTGRGRGGVKSKPCSHGAERPAACNAVRRSGGGNAKKAERATSLILVRILSPSSHTLPRPLVRDPSLPEPT